MNKISYGYASATSGALIWGMAPLYYHLLNEFPLMEVVAQRAFWSCVLFIVPDSLSDSQIEALC